MRRAAPPCLAFVLAAALAGTAHADSTTTQAVPPGGSMRSSTDAAPSPETPLIVTVTNTNQPPSPPPPGTAPFPGSDGSVAVTVTLKDKHERATPSGFEFAGPQADIAGEGNLALAFDVDRSVPLPGYIRGPKGGRNYYTLLVAFEGDPYSLRYTVTDLPDGDFRLVPECCGAGSYDILQQAFYALAQDSHDSLPDALKNGVGIGLKRNFRCTADWTIKVSSAVARRLKLKSTTIGAKSFGPSGGNGRVPLVRAARRALRRYSRVSVTAHVVATAPNGQVIRDKTTFTLKTPEGELG